MNIIFAGTPAISATVLSRLLGSQHKIVAVYTQPDRPAGRGRQLMMSPVKTLAIENNLSIEQPLNFKDPVTIDKLKHYQPDIMVVVAYGLLLPQAVLTAPRLGCLNIHVSLLPRWRGAAPIQRAILAGDQETGVTIMKMDEGLDTGPILLKSICPIAPDDTSESLHDKLAALGADNIIEALDHIDVLKPKTQIDKGASYAAKITKQEAEINWQEAADVIDRKIRGFYPWPIAFTHLKNETIRIWKACVLDTAEHVQPGCIVGVDKQGIDVATGKGTLRLLTMQFPGKKAQPVADILNAKKNVLHLGVCFEISKD